MKKLLILVLLAMIGTLLFSQENSPKSGSTGLLVAIGSPQTTAIVGLNIFLADTFLLRPEINFNLSAVSKEPTTPTVEAVTTIDFGFGVTGLFEFKVAPSFLIGVGANLGLNFNSQNTSFNSSNPGGTGSNEGFTTQFIVAAVVDLHYAFTKNFAVFADTGLAFSTKSTSFTNTFNSNSSTSAVTNTFGLYRTSLGVVFYF